MRKSGGSLGPHALYNLGKGDPEPLERLIAAIEQACGRPAIRDNRPMQAGDVHATYADIAPTRCDLGYAPATPISVGVPRFVDWFRDYGR